MQQKFKNIFPLLVAGLVLTLIICRAVLADADTDIWGHVRFGQDILKMAAVPTLDSYSYLTGSHEWVNHEWLTEVIFALFYNLGGAPGLVALKSLLIMTITLLLWKSLLNSGFRLLPSAIAMIFVEILLVSVLPTLRPHLFSCLFLALELLILTSYTQRIRTKNTSRIIWLLPLLFVFWANCHGGFLMGLMILFVWWLTNIGETVLSRNQLTFAKHWLPALVVTITVVITVVNPYGPELLGYLIRTNGLYRTLYMKGPFVSEWQPLFKVNIIYGAYYLIAVAITVASFFYSRKPKYLSAIMIWLFLALTAFIIYRALPLFGIATVILAGQHLADCWHQIHDYMMNKPQTYLIFLIGITCWLFISILGLVTQLSGIPGQLVLTIPIPVRAVALLKKMEGKANVLVEFNWAEYFIWHLGPRMKVAIDPRCETVYPDYCLYDLYNQFAIAGPHWSDIIDRCPTDLVLIGPDANITKLMQAKPGWVKMYADSICCLFVRKDSSVQRRFTAVDQSAVKESMLSHVFP